MHDRPIDRNRSISDAHAFILATERRQTLPRIAPPVRILSFRVAGCAVARPRAVPRAFSSVGSAARRAICAIHRDQWRFELLLMSARGNIIMCGRFECVSFVRFDVIRGTITAHAHSPNTSSSQCIHDRNPSPLERLSLCFFPNEINSVFLPIAMR